MKKIVIIGGGTAGWLTALVVNKFWKDTNVILIESSKIGILGAGEGSTPNFGSLLNLLDIHQKDFFERTGATVKTGLNFINWTADKRQPKHMFLNYSDNTYHSSNGYHFDARKVSEFFREIAVNRGVNLIDDEVVKIYNTNETINSLLLNSGSIINDIDFVFDCTGFARLITKKLHNEEWIDYSKYLLLNKAIGYFLPQEKTFKFKDKEHTQIISMNSGWMWQTPLQHRWGCGYVFNDKFTSVEEAKKEVEAFVGEEIKIQRVFDFNPGRFKRSWIGNSVSIGLSYGFIEPLEATGLMSTIMQLKRLIDVNFDESYRDGYNIWCENITEQIMMFIRYHYLCERFDTPYWRESFKMPIPEKLKKILNEDNNLILKTNIEILKELDLKEVAENELIFGVHNFRMVYNKNKKFIKKELI
jgi:tryptophan halogenase